MDINPYQPPVQLPDNATDANYRCGKILIAVKSQRAMMWLMLVKLVLDFYSGIANESLGKPIVLVFWLAYLAVGVAIAFFMYRLADAMYGMGPAVICALTSLAPCLGVFAILILNGNAMDWLRKRGIKSGFMGVTPEQIQDLAANQAEDGKTAHGPESR